MTARDLVVAALCTLGPTLLNAQATDSAAAGNVVCEPCSGWNAARQPFRIFGNTWYVGTEGLSAVLITSSDGHVLIDGGLPQSARRIIGSIRELGFRVEDVKLIVNSHAHYDHAGGIASLQAASGAVVVAHPWSAEVMRRGRSVPGDPQYGLDIPYPPVAAVRTLSDGEAVRVGAIELTAHFTGGHTPGGTSWSWRACTVERCMDVVYADSQTPVSADDFFFTRSATYREAIDDFGRGHALLEGLSCDVLLTPHPSFSNTFERFAGRGDEPAMADPDGCRLFVARARQQLARRIAAETLRR